MITTPDRLAQAAANIERGEQVDWRKLADLQALDLAQAGRRFVEQAIVMNEEFDAAAVRQIGGQT